LLARLLTEYYRAEGRPVAAFDVNPDEFMLADYLPRHAAVASIDNTPGQMALFDELIQPDGYAKVVDLGYASFAQFFALMREIDFVYEARRRAIEPVILFVTDLDKRTVQLFSMLRKHHGAIVTVLVHNEWLNRGDLHLEKYQAGHALPVLRLPELSPVVRGIIDKPSFSFAEFRARSVDRPTEIHIWLERVFREFHQLELRLLIEALRFSLQFQP
jgi:hypothetical protein